MILFIAVLIAAVLVLSLEALAVMITWNYLAPEVIPTSDIDFWQALAVVVLSYLLFRGSGVVQGSSDSKKSRKALDMTSKT